MKIRSILVGSILGLAATSVNAATLLAQTESSSWSIARAVDLTGNQETQTITDTATTSISVGKYTGADPLLRVVIRYVQPNPPTSPILEGTVSMTGATGSTVFDSVTVNNSTTITPPENDLQLAIFAAGGGNIGATSTVSDSDTITSTTLSGSGTLDFQVEYDRNQTIWDSADHAGVTASELADIFTGGGPFSFGISSSVSFSFVRDNSQSILLQTSGTDSGYVEILYYVPEPSTALLGGLGLLTLLRRRR